MDIRARRAALGLSRKELAIHAKMDAAVIQLIELGQWGDAEAVTKLEGVIVELEKAQPKPVPPENGSSGPASA